MQTSSFTCVPVKNEARKVLINMDEQLRRWRKHFEQVLNQSRMQTTVKIQHFGSGQIHHPRPRSCELWRRWRIISQLKSTAEILKADLNLILTADVKRSQLHFFWFGASQSTKPRTRNWAIPYKSRQNNYKIKLLISLESDHSYVRIWLFTGISGIERNTLAIKDAKSWTREGRCKSWSL